MAYPTVAPAAWRAWATTPAEGDWEGLPTRAELVLLDLPEGTTVG
jgi:hypothetical protein